MVNISVPNNDDDEIDAPDAAQFCHCDLQQSGFIKHGRMGMQEADRCRHLYSRPCTFTAVGSG